jgi:hypothetical protein
MWLPQRLYQLLPAAYLVSGLLMLASFGDEYMGFISGSMLCAAAVLIWVLRAYGGSRTTKGKR